MGENGLKKAEMSRIMRVSQNFGESWKISLK